MCELLSVVDRFNAELNRITTENRDGIRHVTKIAYALAPFAICVVKSVCAFIRKLPTDKKLIGIYIMDSIVKCNHEAVAEYRRLFDKEIVNLITETFQKMSFDSRLPFYECRKTWKSIFSNATLEQLDRRINGIDPAWPMKTAVEVCHQRHQPVVKPFLPIEDTSCLRSIEMTLDVSDVEMEDLS